MFRSNRPVNKEVEREEIEDSAARLAQASLTWDAKTWERANRLGTLRQMADRQARTSTDTL